ncbi:tRNA pseudouridine38-40 synthase [Clostridium amylolyticum]|uniref:tRNA pseudouridine synthase A n=1 Tax=Clostridium amylolyticum TaxID=1121298 RepID=A0A1M6JR23_9CLOT|nr:tRNA pseudouridine(38-40) synthase TruA [Clostridium amylolyticum]SHJ49126.1 tRNA pseudouridine38-40 synthase [Clostridium amylolyticum]
MKNIKIIIEYDGTNYFGWQRQNSQITIQECIEEALNKVTGENISVTGSSRTDSGVHAKGFVANFKTNSTIPPEKFKDALNTKLPSDIVVKFSEEVDLNFHSRYACKGKTYKYTILNQEQRSALLRNYTYFVKANLNIQLMQEACKYFIGKQDFEAFKSTGSSVKTSIRTITELYIERKDNIIEIYVSADGFLYNMVRIIVGTLIEVGTGKIKPEDIKDIINSKDRNKTGKCVPPQGLILEKVYY